MLNKIQLYFSSVGGIMLIPIQIDFNKISKALSGSLEMVKQTQSVPLSALQQLESAQKQLQKALTYKLSR